MTTTAEPEDYTGEDGLLYCGKCRTAKEAYFPKETAAWLGHDKHPTECDCQREKRLECEFKVGTNFNRCCEMCKTVKTAFLMFWYSNSPVLGAMRPMF